MKKTKYLIGFLLLFMIVGFAAISVTLSIRGTTRVASTLDDFKVYFSNVLVDGEQDFSVVRNEKELYFDILIEEVGDTHNIVYDVTNGSKYYDAQLSINCTTSNEYLNIVNNIDTSTDLLSKETRQGTLSLTKIKTIASDLTQNNAISCKLSATPVERTSINSTTPAAPVDPFYIGREVAIGDEKFNVINWDDDTVTMLAKYNIDENNRQNTAPYKVTFSDGKGWEYQPGPLEIDIQIWGGESKQVLNEYTEYIRELLDDSSITGDLLTLKDLKKLGCIIPDNYSYPELVYRSCNESQYIEWLANGQNWWIRSARSDMDDRPWIIGSNDNYLYSNVYSNTNGIRPSITISKEVALQLINVYPIGKEISIGDEKFNVISDNGTTISMLAKYNLYQGDSTTQSSEQVWSLFSKEYGWEYSPGPKEIDIQNFEGRAKLKVNNYLVYLKETYNIDGTGDLISVSELERLGCKIPENYSSERGGNCKDSKHKDWLINNQHFWTKSATPESPDYLWVLSRTGILYVDIHSGYYGVRPVITISKGALSQIKVS